VADVATELEIINKSLDDILRRLEAAPQTPKIQQLAGRALAFRRRVNAWKTNAPTGEECSATLQKVLTMQVEIMNAGIKADD
jgi:hypothetical protein